MITVTKTFFPPIEEYKAYIDKIWESKWLTNNGDLTKELTGKLTEHLNANHLILMTNGTLPIQIALNAFAEQGEVITTPFSYVATTSSIVWEKCTPVFVDIHPEYLTIDETKIEEAITSKTTAILVTHVYGNPCDIEAIDAIARKYKLKVIYDAAHCFGVKYKNKPIFNYGDVSVCSFHATKLFHTGEGGALFCQDENTYNEMLYRHKFGHDGPLRFHGIGINAKISELQAAMGLSVLPYIDAIIQDRKRVCQLYDDLLDFKLLRRLKIRAHTEWNYSYYPVIFNSEAELLKTEKLLHSNEIVPRRYFYPSLSSLSYVNNTNDLKVSDDIAPRILCLPLYYGLENDNIKKISELISTALGKF
ncbi:DegT/DnrJ/EryC1/StrS aminotransferase family protein [uncultured Psychroserpens sp.]|uniref:DegT/DnrJ/EryC1/StrS family aminotransferase n=1 Tax=uncultured Psychroserpens sp. TaxID=255436 RepID=UPI0026095C43|nr:DegT/DnrJ/EryC1/StrS family aminotransferase [uncultured Psychroserpens sp.]